MREVYDYRGRTEELQKEIELIMENFTPEQIEQNQRKTEEALQRFYEYMADYEARFRQEPSEKKRVLFQHTVFMLRELADIADGLLEVETTDNIGVIQLTLEGIQHTIDSVDPTRFVFAFLFMNYDGISIFPHENTLQVKIVARLYDEVPK